MGCLWEVCVCVSLFVILGVLSNLRRNNLDSCNLVCIGACLATIISCALSRYRVRAKRFCFNVCVREFFEVVSSEAVCMYDCCNWLWES
jgi:hypothetical protein